MVVVGLTDDVRTGAQNLGCVWLAAVGSLAVASGRPEKENSCPPFPERKASFQPAKSVGSIALASGRQPLDPVCGGVRWQSDFIRLVIVGVT